MQAQTSAEISTIIKKCVDDAELNDQEMALIRMWMVSDAAFYTEMENDYPDWIRELGRLVGELARLGGAEKSPDSLGKMSGVTRDAIRVIGAIAFYNDQRERVQRFDKNTATLDARQKLLLADLLRSKLHRDDI